MRVRVCTCRENITVWIKGDFVTCTALSPTRATTNIAVIKGVGKHSGMTGATLGAMDEYCVLAFGESNSSVAIQTGATEIRKWMTRLVVASGTTGVNLSAIAPLLQQSERVLTPLAPASHSLGATAGKLQDVVSELQRAVGCITAGAKQWQAQERQAVLDLHPDWSGHLVKFDFGDGPVASGFLPVRAGAAQGQCPELCLHQTSFAKHAPVVCVCPEPSSGWPRNATMYNASLGYGFEAAPALQA
jgi:hypothetical protein